MFSVRGADPDERRRVVSCNRVLPTMRCRVAARRTRRITGAVASLRFPIDCHLLPTLRETPLTDVKYSSAGQAKCGNLGAVC